MSKVSVGCCDINFFAHLAFPLEAAKYKEMSIQLETAEILHFSNLQMPGNKLPVQPGRDPLCVRGVIRVPESRPLQAQVASQQLVMSKLYIFSITFTHHWP